MEKEYFPPEAAPKLLILISGKRKCGKDYLTDLVEKRLDEESIGHSILRVAGVIKYYYALKHSLDFEKMLDSSPFKEQHRVGLQRWSDEVRAQSYGYLCVESIKMAEAEGKPIWICADIRDHLDYNWFLQHYSHLIKRVRIQADESVRKQRGWTWQDTIDDGRSECDLDHVTDWDLVITNNGAAKERLETPVSTIMSWIHTAVKQ